MVDPTNSGSGTGIATDSGLFGGALKYRQPKKGFRSAVDSLALVEFSGRVADCPPGTILDLGCGSGFLMLTASLLWPDAEILGIELSESRHSFALDNIRNNELESRLRAVHADLRTWRASPNQTFDLIIANPPFYPLGSGTLPPDPDKAMARFEVCFSLEDLMSLSTNHLAESGHLTCIYPHERRDELVSSAEQSGLELHREQWVFPKKDTPPRYVLTAWKKAGSSKQGLKTTFLEPLFFEDEEGNLGADLRRFEMKLSAFNR